MDVCGCGLDCFLKASSASGQVVTESPQLCVRWCRKALYYYLFYWWYLWYYGFWKGLCLFYGEPAVILLARETTSTYSVFCPVFKQTPSNFLTKSTGKYSSIIWSCLQYLISVLPNQDGRYGNVYCALSLASPAISLLCLFSWHASLIIIGLISRTACWPLIIPVILLALHCGNPVQMINNTAKGRKQRQNRQVCLERQLFTLKKSN